MNIVIPMAGCGRRFAGPGSKNQNRSFLCSVNPCTLGRLTDYHWISDSRLIFVCLRQHLESSGLERDIHSRYGRFDPVIVAIDNVTEGQACTVFRLCAIGFARMMTC